MIDPLEPEIDPLEAVIAIIRSYPLDKRHGSVEVVFETGGVPAHIHERRTTNLRRQKTKKPSRSA